MQIVLPLLRLGEKDRDRIEEDPQEFVNHQIDICQDQESNSYHTQAAKLLESLVQNVDGMLTFVSNFCIECIHNVFQGDQSQSSHVTQIIQKFRIQIQSSQEMVEVCLLVLTSISNFFVKREDLRQQLDTLILSNLEALIAEQ